MAKGWEKGKGKGKGDCLSVVMDAAKAPGFILPPQ